MYLCVSSVAVFVGIVIIDIVRTMPAILMHETTDNAMNVIIIYFIAVTGNCDERENSSSKAIPIIELRNIVKNKVMAAASVPIKIKSLWLILIMLPNRYVVRSGT